MPPRSVSGPAAAARLRYVAIGDSFTIGTSVAAEARWPDQLVAALAADATSLRLIANLGVDGFTSRDVIEHELPQLDLFRPQFATLLVGVNDVVQEVPAATYRENVTAILEDLLRRVGPERIVAVTTPDYTVAPAGRDYGDPVVRSAAIRENNAALRRLAEGRGIAVVDVFELSRRAADEPTLVAPDGLHPSGAQYALWTERIAPVVRRLLSTSGSLVGVRRLAGTAEIRRHADLKAAARDWSRFSSDLQGDPDVRTYRQLPLEVDPPTHADYRSILMPIFNRPDVAALEPQLRDVARTLVARFGERGAVDALRDLAVPMVASSIATAFGRPQDADELASWGVTSWEILPDGTRSGTRLEAYLDRVLAEVRRRPGADAFSLIDAGQVNGRPLTRIEKLGLGNLILAGGRDTVIGLICGAVWHLAGNDPDRRALARDPGGIPLAIEELLRFLSPLPRMERRAAVDVSGEWGSAVAGEIVLLGFAPANHDAAVFDRHEAIRIDRRPNPHVAFGNGPHTCIGVHLARLEARVFLEELLAAVPDWHLGDGVEIGYREIEGARVPESFTALPIEIGR
jgi:cytochrome P450